MKSGLRGGKPRDMATFKKGGTSRGAGAAKKGFDYAIYKKGGKVKKYQEGGALPERDPQTGTRQYASFSDWMGDLFGKKKEAPKVNETKAIPDEDTGKNMAMRRVADVPVMQGVEPPAAPRPRAQQRRMAQRATPSARTPALPMRNREGMMSPEQERRAREAEDLELRNLDVTSRARRIVEDMTRDEQMARERAARERQASSGLYAKGGGVKMAGGGSCRGMGAATKGGKYTIK